MKVINVLQFYDDPHEGTTKIDTFYTTKDDQDSEYLMIKEAESFFKSVVKENDPNISDEDLENDLEDGTYYEIGISILILRPTLHYE